MRSLLNLLSAKNQNGAKLGVEQLASLVVQHVGCN